MKSKLFIALALFMMVEIPAYAGIVDTMICIRNWSSAPHRIDATSIENYDWEGDNRPDHNFTNISISPGETICRNEDINSNANNVAFTFLIDGAPSRMLYSGYEKPKNGPWRFEWGVLINENNPLRLHGEKTLWYLRQDWQVGYYCGGNKCRVFEIH